VALSFSKVCQVFFGHYVFETLLGIFFILPETLSPTNLSKKCYLYLSNFKLGSHKHSKGSLGKVILAAMHSEKVHIKP